MKNITIIAAASLILVSASSYAQINYLQTSQQNSSEGVVMGVTANTNTYVTFGGYIDWSSPAQPALLGPGYTMAFGPNDGRIPIWNAYTTTANALSNASGRGVIRGANKNGGSSKGLLVGVGANQNLRIVIWGPTLNQFGVNGATNFSWTVQVDGTTHSSGTGEATVNVSISSAKTVNVIMNPTSNDELGSVMANFYIN
jgi:hypothetical protein